MANVSPFMSPGPMSQVFFPPGGPSPPGSVVVHQGTPVSVHTSQTPGFPTVDMMVAQGPGGASGMPSGPPAPAGVSFIIQIGLTRESVLLPQTADLAYIKQIACSIVDQKMITTSPRLCLLDWEICELGFWLLPSSPLGFRQSSELINRVVSHPSQPVSITAHENRTIRYLDNKTGKVIHSMVAHLDAVTCLTTDPKGTYLISGSHDCSVRLWMLDNRTCVQEITAHRKKHDEAIHDVAFHPSQPFIASAGADALAKIFV
ncbi:striatin-4-like isoform X2 [Siphateles boraxobius]|uniref:striatin-4-like isoform X2 n=1 Tax=Siphateles boraxobius TaxID=180520 RepID=UPI004063266E